jgi:hypothetical protein
LIHQEQLRLVGTTKQGKFAIASRGSILPRRNDTAVEQRNELLNLLDERWYPLANGFRAAGIPAPREVDWDIVIDARVSGQRAVMVWVFHCEMWDELHSKILWMGKWRLKMKLRQYSIWAMA